MAHRARKDGKKMFDKFGEFDSAEDLNVTAATMLEEGKVSDLISLGLENGIDKDDIQDFIDGVAAELCTPLMAAVGKLTLESKELNLPVSMEGYVLMIQDMATTDKALAKGIRKKGKKLVEALGAILKLSSKNRVQLPKELTKAAGIPANVYVGDVDKATFKKTIREYYAEG